MKLRYNNKNFKVIDSCSFRSSNNEVTFNDIKIDFTGYSLVDIPFKYQEVEILKDENIFFTGYVENIKVSTMKKKKEYRELTITLLSPLKMATVRTISLIGTYETSEAIRRILQPLIDDGFTIKEINIGDGQITTNFVLETIENAMNNVCSKKNIFWYINEKKEIFVNSIDYLFGKAISKTITENDDFRKEGLIGINPTIENVDYSNVINFKNVRLIYSSFISFMEPDEEYPIVCLGKDAKKGDIINFDKPIIIDENYLKKVMQEQKEEKIYYCFKIVLLDLIEDDPLAVKEYYISINADSENKDFVISKGISFSDDSEEGEIILQRDSFFPNLITGFKWNLDKDVRIKEVGSDTALRYTTMKFMYSAEINKLKNIISKSGQIEKTIDYNEKWTSLSELIDYARSLMTQNSNVVNSVELEYDINPNLKVGDIVDIDLPSFYINGNFAVKEISYTYKNEIEQDWKITLKSADLISTYIDMFRPVETEEAQNTIDTIILSEFVEENIKEIHELIKNNDNNTLNFKL